MRFFCVLLLFSLFFSPCYADDAYAAPAKNTAQKQSAAKKATVKPTKRSATTQKTAVSSKSKQGKSKKRSQKTVSRQAAKKKTVVASPAKSKKGKKNQKAQPKKNKRTKARQTLQPSTSTETPAQGAVVPISVRGGGVNFERAIEACLYRDTNWLLPNQTVVDVEDQLAHFAPTFISGAMRFSETGVPSESMISSWNKLRSRLQSMNSAVGFDITLDLEQYKTASEAASHMQRLAKALVAEAWTFTNAASVAQSKPEILAAAIAEARLQGRSVGVILYDDKLPVGVDYAVVASGYSENTAKLENNALINRVRKKAGEQGNSDFPVLVVSGMGKVPGEGFLLGTTPSERRKLVLTVAKNQERNVAFAYPVFGPITQTGQSYDATRDEFMVDTVRRNMKRYNPLSNRSSIGMSAMDED